MKILWGALLVLFTVGIIVINVAKEGKSLNVSYIKPTEGAIVDKVFASGKLEAVYVKAMYVDINAVIREVNVHYGDTVKKGQMLLTYNLDETERQLKQEKNNLQILIEERKNLLKQQFELMKKQVEEQGMVLQSDKDKLDTTSTELRISNQKLVIEALQKRMSVGGLIADSDGVVTELHAEVGQVLAQGMKAVVITGMDKLQVRVNMTELDVGKIQLGMKTKITGDAFQKIYSGKVHLIAPIAVIPAPIANDDPVVEVLIDVDGDFNSGEVKPGFNVSVEFNLVHKPELLLPLTAVKHEGEQAYGFKQVNGKAVKVKLKTGKEDDEQVEILEGLKANDMMIAKVTNELEDGKKVKEP